MAFIQTYGMQDAPAELRAVYEGMKGRPLPAVYIPPRGDVAGIVRAHSMDPARIPLAFGMVSSSLWQGDTLSWPQREMINTVTSRANQCFY